METYGDSNRERLTVPKRVVALHSADTDKLHAEETVQDAVVDGIDRLQQDGGVSPEIEHRQTRHQMDLRSEKEFR